MQCFKSNDNELIVKELALKDEEKFRHFLFKPPYARGHLWPKTCRINDYCTRNIHGFKWEKGYDDYIALKLILKSHCRNKKFVLTKGSEKKRFLEKYLDLPVFDLDDMILKSFDALPPSADFLECPYQHNNYSCAGLNAYKIYEWFLKIREMFLTI